MYLHLSISFLLIPFDYHYPRSFDPHTHTVATFPTFYPGWWTLLLADFVTPHVVHASAYAHLPAYARAATTSRSPVLVTVTLPPLHPYGSTHVTLFGLIPHRRFRATHAYPPRTRHRTFSLPRSHLSSRSHIPFTFPGYYGVYPVHYTRLIYRWFDLPGYRLVPGWLPFGICYLFTLVVTFNLLTGGCADYFRYSVADLKLPFSCTPLRIAHCARARRRISYLPRTTFTDDFGDYRVACHYRDYWTGILCWCVGVRATDHTTPLHRYLYPTDYTLRYTHHHRLRSTVGCHHYLHRAAAHPTFDLVARYAHALHYFTDTFRYDYRYVR